MKRVLIALAGILAMAFAAPTVAQPVAACPAAPDFSRYGADREAIEYSRAMGQSVNAREGAAGLDRAADLAMLLLPDLVAESGRACAGGAPAEPSPAARCNAAQHRALSTYLASVIAPEQIRDVWSFIVPRAGPIPATDPAMPLTGWRFTVLSAVGTPLRYNQVAAPPHIDNRRERAWQYLVNHRNGRAVMSALNQFVASRIANGRSEAALCPAAAGGPSGS